MALPNNTLSSPAVPSTFIGAAAQSITRTFDYEDGPISLQDPSSGLMYQMWQARILGNNQILVSALNTPEYEFYSGAAITDVSIAFDQNANFYCVYIDQGTTYFYWYDTLVPGNVTWNMGTDMITPKITLDDKRDTQNARSDVILTYLKPDGALYYRQQRDRFQIERQLDAGPIVGIEKFGKNDGYRLQWLLSRD